MVTLKERQAGELNQVFVTHIVLCQQCEVVVLLAPTFIGSAVVVHLAAARNSLCAVIVGHVRLGTQNGFNALLLTFLVEVDDAIHVAVVCNTKSRLTIFNSLLD